MELSRKMSVVVKVTRIGNLAERLAYGTPAPRAVLHGMICV